MNVEMIIVVAGRMPGAPSYTVLTEEATRSIFEKLTTPEEHVVAYKDALGETKTAPIVAGSVRLVELHDGAIAIKALVELPDDFEVPAPATAKTGRELTEADRRAKMPAYEEQIERSTVE